jgi:hypothetical protein
MLFVGAINGYTKEGRIRNANMESEGQMLHKMLIR